MAPYDAELFGHWWFEGPDWINFLLRKMHYDQQTVKTITVPEYLEQSPQHAGGPADDCRAGATRATAEVWLEGSNDWIYRHLHEGADRMVELARENPDPTPLRRRALNQAARELLLAQSSDWAFILKTGTMVDYAIQRTRVHVVNLNHLYEQLKHNDIDEHGSTRSRPAQPLPRHRLPGVCLSGASRGARCRYSGRTALPTPAPPGYSSGKGDFS